jgi:hypothetical protein
MSTDSDSGCNSQIHLRVLRQHVLSPLSTAADILERERAEFGAEIEAFQEFARRVDAIPSQSTPPREFVESRRVTVTETTTAMDQVRAAYRATVMAVPHYETVYGESLHENVASELGPDLSDGIRPETTVRFTDTYKEALIDATAGTIERRRRVRAAFERELNRLQRAETELRDLLDHTDTVVIPSWYRPRFTSRLDRLLQRRQETLQSRTATSSHSYQNLTCYLYGNQPWRYPILVATLRLREAVVL